MRKVLILTNSINGIYNFRRELIEELINKGYNVIISSPRDIRCSYFKKIGCQLVETSINRRGTNPIADFKLIINYYRLVKKVKPDVVLTYTIKPNIYGGVVCRVLGIPYLTNITGLGTAVENRGFLQYITVFLYRIALKRAKCVFCQNKENLDFMVKNSIIANRYKLVPGSGVNLEYYRLMEYPDDSTIHFLFISRIIKEKGIDQYLEAAKYIKKRYPNTTFHIIGSCEQDYVEKLNDMERKGIIIYHGRQNDIRKFHKISHCTIHPTYYPEGMSNVLLESAACGRPVITTNRSGCKEIVDDGINGYLVKQKDSQDLIKKIEKFISLDNGTRKNMGIAAREKVESGFDRNIVVKAYMQEIENCVNSINMN